MEGIPVYYSMQSNEHDDSLNVYFLPTSFKSQNEVQIKDVVQHFPLLNSGRYYHFRFYAICDKDQKTWVDISNLTAKVPNVDNRMLIKVLEIEKPSHSRIFASFYKSLGSSSNNQQSAPQQSHHSREQTKTQNHPVKKSVSSDVKTAQHNNQEPATKPTPSHSHHHHHHQQQSQPQASHSKTPPPKSNTADDFDLLGGGFTAAPSSGGNQTKPAQQNTTAFTPFDSKPTSAEEEKVYSMSREELGAYKQNKMDSAIQAQVDFANAVWQSEEKSKQDKSKAYDELEDQIKNWAGKLNQRNNIIALLSTVQNVVWQGCDWKALSFSDLMGPAAIKKNYFKAITKFHPDKNQGGDYRQKYICERVTNELNAAWDEFRKANP